MLEVFLKGVAVGVAVAAPVGPIGLLCIRRTIAKGWHSGLVSGFGAASADAVYGFIVAAGLTATSLLDYARPMQIGGGILIAALGIMALRDFRCSTRTAIPGAVSATGDYSTTFGLTITNPMTILAFLGLMAGLGTGTSATPLAPYWLVAGVFTGSMLWWAILVGLSVLMRRQLPLSALRWADLVSGLILLTWGSWIVWRGAAG